MPAALQAAEARHLGLAISCVPGQPAQQQIQRLAALEAPQHQGLWELALLAARRMPRMVVVVVVVAPMAARPAAEAGLVLTAALAAITSSGLAAALEPLQEARSPAQEPLGAVAAVVRLAFLDKTIRRAQAARQRRGLVLAAAAADVW